MNVWIIQQFLFGLELVGLSLKGNRPVMRANGKNLQDFKQMLGRLRPADGAAHLRILRKHAESQPNTYTARPGSWREVHVARFRDLAAALTVLESEGRVFVVVQS